MTDVATDGAEGERLNQLLPPELLPLFDDRFIKSCSLFEEYVHRLSLKVVLELGLDAAAREPATPGEISSRAGLDPGRAPVAVGWLFSMLALADRAVRVGEDRFVISSRLEPDDPDEVASAQESHDPAALASYRMAALAASLYAPVLRGTITGEESLFSPEHAGAWFDYFSNDNPLYAISNRIGALVAERMSRDDGAVLEIGGGLGSGMAALLERFEACDRLAALRSYRFTEIAPSFLRRGQRRMAGRFPDVPRTFGRLDMDRPFAEAGVDAGAFDLVYGVNTLHVARDLEATLAEIRRALVPGGALVLSECIRPFPGRPVHVELLFNLLEAFRSPRLVAPWRPNGGFLTPGQWTAALGACGFDDVRVYPDIARIHEVYPSFVVAVISAVRG